MPWPLPPVPSPPILGERGRRGEGCVSPRIGGRGGRHTRWLTVITVDPAQFGADWETLHCTQVLPDKLAIDLAYLAQRSLTRDLTLILQTIAAVRK